MTTFKSAIAICGLTAREAADFLSVSHDTVKSWSQGRNAPPMGVWRDLAGLYARIANAANARAHNLDPETMTLRAANEMRAAGEGDSLPGRGPDAAGAVALLTAMAQKI